MFFFFFNFRKQETPEMLATRAALLSKVREINGKTVGEVDTTHYLANPKNKGRIGQVIQIYLGKEPDNDAGADFPEAGVELKVTGLISGKSGYRAKERLVLHMIDYKKDHGISFEESGLLKKCDTMLITTYQYLPSRQKGVPPDYASFPIVDSFVYKLSDEDIAVMKNDYDAILDKINSGHAEELSESDTEYLAACTKGVNGDQRVAQYNSDVLAKPRAFSLKSSFLTSIIKKCMGEDVFENFEPAEIKPDQPGICQLILGDLYSWYGRTETQLQARFPDVKNPKSKYADYVSRMLGLKDLESTEEFQKANIHIKTIRVEEDGTIEQHMSFGAFDFCDVASTKWEDSDWYAYFAGARFLFAVFKMKDGEYVFDRVLFYSLPEIVTEGFIKYTYERTQATLQSGKIVTSVKQQHYKNGKTSLIHYNNFVGSKENPVSHVRPHGSDFWHPQKDLPVADKFTGYKRYETQCFWFDKKYVKAILEGKDGEYLLKALDSMSIAGHDVDFDL